MRVLIVDDSMTMRRFLRSLVEPVAAHIDDAENGAKALEALATKGPFDLALVDWDMPVMNGLELVKQVRANPRLESLKVIMVTAKTSMEDLARAMLSGADDYLMKPLTEEMVLDKLRILGLIE